MKDVTYDFSRGPGRLRLSEIDMPEPGKGQIRVKVLACAVNLSDWENLNAPPLWVRSITGSFGSRDVILGSDIVGFVDKLGQPVFRRRAALPSPEPKAWQQAIAF